MKVVFFGGGAQRTLPIVRSALAAKRIFCGGEIVLYDRDRLRAETMGRMIAQTPEYTECPCRITWDASLDKALEGADLVHVVLMAGSPLSYELGHMASQKHGFISSDNVSLNGAFLALKGGPILLGLARQMEQRCPDAWLINFVNPAPVLSAVVNHHTKIRAAGICSGFVHYMWDLPRLMGRDAFDPDFDVDVAGMNHLSFILRGTYRDRELYGVLDGYFRKRWRPARPQPAHAGFWHTVHFGLWKMFELYRKFGVVLFSMEFDGMAHLFYEEMFEAFYRKGPRTRAQAEAAVKKALAWRRKADARFRDLAGKRLDRNFWAARAADGDFGREDDHVTVRFLKGLCGLGRQKIVVSRPNRGAVAGFPDRAVLEYSQFLDRKSLRPVPGLAVPQPFQGIIGSLVAHQGLLADAIGAGDPKILYHALQAYPVRQSSRAARDLCLDLLEINRGEIAGGFQKARDYLRLCCPAGKARALSQKPWRLKGGKWRET